MTPACRGAGEFAAHEAAADDAEANGFHVALLRETFLFCDRRMPSINRAALSWKIASISRASSDAQFLAGLLDGAQVFIHEQRVAGFDLRRLAVMVEMERMIGPVDVGPVAILPAAAHVQDRIVRAVEKAVRAEVLERDAMGGGVQHRRRVEVQAGIIRELRQRLQRVRLRVAAPQVGDAPGRCSGSDGGSRAFRGRCPRGPGGPLSAHAASPRHGGH